jgi:Exocyst complex component Sec10
MQEYIDRLSGQVDGQTLISDRVFPSPTNAMLAFIKEVLKAPVTDYVIQLIDRTRQGGEVEVYLKAVVETYHQCRRLVLYLNKPKDASKDFRITLSNYLDTLFEPQIEPFLRVQLDYYKKCCDTVVESWKQKVSLYTSILSY